MSLCETTHALMHTRTGATPFIVLIIDEIGTVVFRRRERGVHDTMADWCFARSETELGADTISRLRRPLSIPSYDSRTRAALFYRWLLWKLAEKNPLNFRTSPVIALSGCSADSFQIVYEVVWAYFDRASRCGSGNVSEIMFGWFWKERVWPREKYKSPCFVLS